MISADTWVLLTHCRLALRPSPSPCMHRAHVWCPCCTACTEHCCFPPARGLKESLVQAWLSQLRLVCHNYAHSSLSCHVITATRCATHPPPSHHMNLLVCITAGAVKSSHKTLTGLGYEEVAFDMFYTSLVETLEALVASKNGSDGSSSGNSTGDSSSAVVAQVTPATLLKQFNEEGGEGECIVWFCRLLTSAFIRTHADR